MTTYNLFQATMRLLEKCPRSITQTQIAEGAGLKNSWLSEFCNDKIAHPSVFKVQKLHDYLITVCGEQ